VGVCVPIKESALTLTPSLTHTHLITHQMGGAQRARRQKAAIWVVTAAIVALPAATVTLPAATVALPAATVALSAATVALPVPTEALSAATEGS